MRDDEHLRVSKLIAAAVGAIPFIGGCWNGSEERCAALEAAIKEYTGHDWYDFSGEDEWHH